MSKKSRKSTIDLADLRNIGGEVPPGTPEESAENDSVIVTERRSLRERIGSKVAVTAAAVSVKTRANGTKGENSLSLADCSTMLTNALDSAVDEQSKVEQPITFSPVDGKVIVQHYCGNGITGSEPVIEAARNAFPVDFLLDELVLVRLTGNGSDCELAVIVPVPQIAGNTWYKGKRASESTAGVLDLPQTDELFKAVRATLLTIGKVSGADAINMKNVYGTKEQPALRQAMAERSNGWLTVSQASAVSVAGGEPIAPEQG